ncbi:Tetratricopeptide repeat-domain-containing protein [Rhizoctonia solani]|nr:Tetratricopeptide repeat-domain-containing protein [Rhizoctonia solani]
MNNLASTYQDLDRYEDASALHSEALDVRKRVLGKDHPHTLTSMSNLAYICLKLGQIEEAEKLQIDAEKFAQVFGKNH